MFLSTRVDAHRLLGGIRSVIVDEVHAFASDDRGRHLLALLERIQHLTGVEVQRIGLSATVGNPPALLEWLTPRCVRPRDVIAPVTEGLVDPAISIDHVGTTSNAATIISGLHHGEKRLVFVDSRMRAEELTHELRRREVTTFVTHASLGRDERRRAEEAFTQGSDCVIVSTSALELGIDVGDLDRVIQIDAPASVSSWPRRPAVRDRPQPAVPHHERGVAVDGGGADPTVAHRLCAAGRRAPAPRPPPRPPAPRPRAAGGRHRTGAVAGLAR